MEPITTLAVYEFFPMLPVFLIPRGGNSLFLENNFRFHVKVLAFPTTYTYLFNFIYT